MDADGAQQADPGGHEPALIVAGARHINHHAHVRSAADGKPFAVDGQAHRSRQALHDDADPPVIFAQAAGQRIGPAENHHRAPARECLGETFRTHPRHLTAAFAVARRLRRLTNHLDFLLLCHRTGVVRFRRDLDFHVPPSLGPDCMNPRVLRWALVTAAVLGIAVVVRVYLSKNGTEVASPAGKVQQASLAPIVNQGNIGIPDPAPTPDLPAADVPLALFVDDLRERAARGEAAAGCRLAAEFSRCHQLATRRADHDRWLAERRRALDDITDPARRAELAGNIDRELAFRESQLGEFEAHCRDVPLPTAPDLSRIWRNAALAGDPAAMRHYASGNAFAWGNILDVLPELAIYRQEAERLALLGAERGDFELALSLASAYAPGGMDARTLLQQAVEPDPAKALALYRHLQAALARSGNDDTRVAREIGDRIETLEATLDPQGLERASSLAAEMASRWQPLEVRGARDLHAAGSLRPVDRRWCGR